MRAAGQPVRYTKMYSSRLSNQIQKLAKQEKYDIVWTFVLGSCFTSL